MLYIKFKINDSSKYRDFQKLYNYMVIVRKQGYLFEHEIEPIIDWDSLKDDEIDAAVEKLSDFGDPDKFTLKRYPKLIPNYVNSFIEAHLHSIYKTNESISESQTIDFLNYLEWNFEVDIDQLENLDDHSAIVKFSTGNFPFGGLDRFIMTLKAYDLIPIEAFNGFSVIEFNWTSNFEFETIELQEKTKIYLKKHH